MLFILPKTRLCVLSPINKYQPHKPSALGFFIGNDFTGINIKSDIFTVIECGFKERFICLSQGFNTLVVFTQASKPAGNVSSNTDNLGFIKTCQDALPKGTKICWGFI
jgi:hypothetical protein